MEFVTGVDALRRITGIEVFVEFESANALDNGDALIFGDAGIDGRFIDDDVAGLDDFADCLAGAIEGREVGIVVFVDGRRYGNDVEVTVSDVVDVGGAAETVIVDGVLKQFVADFERCVVTGHKGLTAAGVHIKTDCRIFCREESCKRQAHIAEAYHANLNFFVHCIKL